MYITSIMVSIGFCIILSGLVYILLVRKMHKERSSAAITGQVRAEIDRMIVDLNQTADRNIGLIEQRIESLGDLIKEADHRISLLQKHADNLSRTTDTYSRIRPNTITTAQPESSRTDTSSQTAQKALGSAFAGPERSEDQPGGTANRADPQEPELTSGADSPSVASGKSKREQVISLHRQGISPDIIASRVDSTVAEVELIISMTEGPR